VAPSNYHDRALGFLTLATIYKPPRILRGILPDLAKVAEPTLLADKGYDSLRFRRFVREQGFQPLIPTRSCIPAEQATGELYAEDTALQRKRYVVERTLGWLKGFRRLRYRVDRTAASFHAFVYLAMLVLCVRRLISPSRPGMPAGFQARTPQGGGTGRRPRPVPAQCRRCSRHRRSGDTRLLRRRRGGHNWADDGVQDDSLLGSVVPKFASGRRRTKEGVTRLKREFGVHRDLLLSLCLRCCQHRSAQRHHRSGAEDRQGPGLHVDEG
jgi:transposase